MVACQWASLEDTLDHFLAHVNNGPALNQNGGSMSFQSRIKLLKKIINSEVYDQIVRTAFISLFDLIDLANKMDKHPLIRLN